MGLFRNKKNIDWYHLTDLKQLDEIIDASNARPQLIYKHSTRCGVCSMVRSRLDGQWSHDGRIDPWHLDLLKHRDISNAIAERFGIHHESPQIIVLVNGEVAQHISHEALSASDLDELAAKKNRPE